MAIEKLKNIDLYYDEYGTGDRYVLCAQSQQSKINNYTIELAKRGFHVFNITIRGYGQSTHVFEDYGDEWYDIWARDVCDFADAKGIERFFYTGSSHGAGIGWHICINHPERLIAFWGLVAGPHTKNGSETGNARMNTIKAAESPESWKKFVEENVQNEYLKHIKGDESEEELAFLKSWRQEKYDTWISMKKEEALLNPRKPFPKAKSEEALIAMLEEINLPVLLLGGMKDDISLPENLIRSCKAVKNSKLVIYEDATHSLCEEYKEEVCDDIVLFCKQRNL